VGSTSNAGRVVARGPRHEHCAMSVAGLDTNMEDTQQVPEDEKVDQYAWPPPGYRVGGKLVS